ncbi:MAG: SPW repeat protein [Maribacter litoralis]|uniref:SPW repeat domain-containing protein n=1 Tax=Maribacter litoralis TaxID=2059726 RepID=UPI003296C638
MWAKILNIVIGLYLIVAPSFFGYSPQASDNGHIIGPIIVTFSIISLWEATQGTRKWNYPFAVWLLLAPWILGYENNLAMVCDMLVGALVIVFSSFEQENKNRYGGGWASLWQKHPQHIQEVNKDEV